MENGAWAVGCCHANPESCCPLLEGQGQLVPDPSPGTREFCPVQPGEGLSSLRGEKTLNQKVLESPQKSTQFCQGFRWKPVMEKDCLRQKSHLPSY